LISIASLGGCKSSDDQKETTKIKIAEKIKKGLWAKPDLLEKGSTQSSQNGARSTPGLQPDHALQPLQNLASSLR